MHSEPTTQGNIPVEQQLPTLSPHEVCLLPDPGWLESEKGVQLRLHPWHPLCSLAKQIGPEQAAVLSACKHHAHRLEITAMSTA